MEIHYEREPLIVFQNDGDSQALLDFLNRYSKKSYLLMSTESSTVYLKGADDASTTIGIRPGDMVVYEPASGKLSLAYDFESLARYGVRAESQALAEELA